MMYQISCYTRKLHQTTIKQASVSIKSNVQFCTFCFSNAITINANINLTSVLSFYSSHWKNFHLLIRIRCCNLCTLFFFPFPGRELWVMVVSRYPNEEPLLKPNVKYVANMHGNEVSGVFFF